MEQDFFITEKFWAYFSSFFFFVKKKNWIFLTWHQFDHRGFKERETYKSLQFKRRCSINRVNRDQLLISNFKKEDRENPKSEIHIDRFSQCCYLFIAENTRNYESLRKKILDKNIRRQKKFRMKLILPKKKKKESAGFPRFSLPWDFVI